LIEVARYGVSCREKIGSRTRRNGSQMREARLRPEFADLYPTLTPGQWEPAALIAEVVLARFLLLEISETPIQDRILNEEHFEFRGETPDGTPRIPRTSRSADRGDE
jgi:hypothetical protein